jgi:hypothetical protein
MLRTEIHIEEIPRIFIRFCEVVDQNLWLKRVQSINKEIRGRPYLRNYLLVENSLIFKLASLSQLIEKYGWIPRSYRKNSEFYPAITFAAQVLSVHDHIPETQKLAFLGRVRGALKNLDNLNALLLEFTVITQFERLNFPLSLPETGVSASFDLLVENIGINGLEIECKTISADTGRKITRRQALEFFDIARPSFESALQNFQGGICVVLTIPARMPSSSEEKLELVRLVRENIIRYQAESSALDSSIHIFTFDLDLIKGVELNNSSTTRIDVDKITGTENQEVMIIGNSRRVLTFAIQSEQETVLLERIYTTIKDSAKRQVSKTRPAIYIVGLEGIGPEELVNLAIHDSDSKNVPTGLRIIVNKLLASPNREHVVGIGFLSGKSMDNSTLGVSSEIGSVYFFPNRESNFWHKDFSGLFPKW